MVAGIEPSRKRIKCPSCKKYKTAEHLEDDNSGYCDKCGVVWGYIDENLKSLK